ncbi:MAG: family hydrolase [Paucimonas sp.]|nr:family hydrolase [Paucimonas sp.]
MRAVFLDKDGTLVKDIPFNVDPARMQLTPHAGAGLRLLRDAGYQFFVISNQAGVAQGRFEEQALQAVSDKLRSMLAAEGVDLRDFYYCPHAPDGIVARYALQCDCRKPLPGLFHRAAAEHGIALEQSWMIGDILNDVEAGQRAGCRSVLIDNGNETEWLPGPWRTPHVRVPDLLQAARAILAMPSQVQVQPQALAQDGSGHRSRCSQ